MADEQSSANLSERSKQLIRLARTLNAHFTLNNQAITYEKIFAEDGLLPALTRRADQLSSLCLGYGLGATFDEAPDTPLGVAVKFDDSTPEVLRLLCITDVLNEMIKAAPSRNSVSLDELLYD